MTYITESIPGLAQSHHGRFQEISVCLARSMRPPWWWLFGLQQKKIRNSPTKTGYLGIK